MSSNRTARGLAVACVLALAGSLYALPEDSAQPIEIEADEGLLRYDPNGTSVLIGNVQIEQGSLRLEAHRVTISSRDKRMHRIVAEGKPEEPVRFRQRLNVDEPFATGHASRADYTVAKERLELTGDAFLSVSGREFAGDVIFWDIKNGLVDARSSAPGGVKMKWPPEPKPAD